MATVRMYTLIIFMVTLMVAKYQVSLSQKIDGVSFVSAPTAIPDSCFMPIRRVKADWVAIIPYAFSRIGQGYVTYDNPRQWYGERPKGTKELISQARKSELKVMLKPHVWVLGQGWAGDFELTQEKEWEVWERDYENYILNYASMAQEMKVELFCIGTEYRKVVLARPEFWCQLI